MSLYDDMNDNSDCDDCNDNESCTAYYRRLENSDTPTYRRPELKFYDSQINQSVINAGTVVCLNQISNGPFNTTYTGNEVSTRSVSWNFGVYLAQADPLPYVPQIRVSLVWDLQPNSITANYYDIYVYPANIYTQCFQHMNPNNRGRFIVLKTWVYPSPISGQLAYETGSLPIDMRTVFPNADISSFVPQTGALLLTTAQSGPNIYNLTGVFRTRFYDN